MKVTYSEIQTLGYLYQDGHCNKAYDEISREPIIKTIIKKAPLSTGWTCNCDKDGFPLYLKECKEYYNIPKHKWEMWELKEEYRENRPTYSVTISYELIDIELTEAGKKEVERRYKIHKRNMEKYAKLLG